MESLNVPRHATTSFLPSEFARISKQTLERRVSRVSVGRSAENLEKLRLSPLLFSGVAVSLEI